jgi:hypothetical protein
VAPARDDVKKALVALNSDSGDTIIAQYISFIRKTSELLNTNTIRDRTIAEFLEDAASNAPEIAYEAQTTLHQLSSFFNVAKLSADLDQHRDENGLADKAINAVRSGIRFLRMMRSTEMKLRDVNIYEIAQPEVEMHTSCYPITAYVEAGGTGGATPLGAAGIYSGSLNYNGFTVAPAVAENSVVSIDCDNNSWKYGFSYQGNAVAITAAATNLPIVSQALTRNVGEPGALTLAIKLRIQTAVHTDTQTNNQLKISLLARIVSRSEYVAGTAPTTNTTIFASTQKIREDVGGTAAFIVDAGSHTIPIPADAPADSMVLYSLTIEPVSSATYPVMTALSDTFFGIECSAINAKKLIDLTNASCGS